MTCVDQNSIKLIHLGLKRGAVFQEFLWSRTHFCEWIKTLKKTKCDDNKLTVDCCEWIKWFCIKKLLVYEWTRGIKEEVEEKDWERWKTDSSAVLCILIISSLAAKATTNLPYCCRLIILSTLLWMNIIWVAAIVKHLKASRSISC